MTEHNDRSHTMTNTKAANPDIIRVRRATMFNISTPHPQLGYRLLAEGHAHGTCRAGHCYKQAKEEWLTPDLTQCARNLYVAAHTNNTPVPTRLVFTCGAHSPRNVAGRRDAMHNKRVTDDRAFKRRQTLARDTDATISLLSRHASIAPVGFQKLWPDMVYAFVRAASGSHDTEAAAYAATQLRAAFREHVASLSPAEQTLLALSVTETPTQED